MTRFFAAYVIATVVRPFNRSRRAGDHFGCSSLILALACLWPFFDSQPALAEIGWTGEIVPDDPTTWDSSTEVRVGGQVDSTLRVDNGSDILSSSALIGGSSGTTTEVTVDGAGSSAAAIPEPQSLLLIGLVLFVWGIRRCNVLQS